MRTERAFGMPVVQFDERRSRTEEGSWLNLIECLAAKMAKTFPRLRVATKQRLQ